MGEARRRLNLAGGMLIPKNPKKEMGPLNKDLPMVQLISNQTRGDDRLLRRIGKGEAFTMSDGARYIFDRFGTLHKLYSKEGRKN